MKTLSALITILLLAALVASCASEQGYTSTNTATTAHSDAVRTAGSSASMPNNGPSMMGGGPR